MGVLSFWESKFSFQVLKETPIQAVQDGHGLQKLLSRAEKNNFEMSLGGTFGLFNEQKLEWFGVKVVKELQRI